MSKETIELLQNYKPENMAWPAAHQEKIDGVPVIIKHVPTTGWVALTRQGEEVTSIPHIIREVAYLFNTNRDAELVGELYIPGLPFKEISGHVRKKNVQNKDLTLHLFDANFRRTRTSTWQQRMEWVEDFLELQALSTPINHLRIIPWTVCTSPEDAERAHRALMEAKPKAEGSVLHSCGKLWEPGKRSWHVQRMKPVPTIDLRVTGFEEARSEAGEPLGMIGRVIAELSSVDASGALATDEIGIGPGKLNHKERRALWTDFKAGIFKPRIAEVKYMRDDTYDALRQPTFQCWRDDKSVPDTYSRAA